MDCAVLFLLPYHFGKNHFFVTFHLRINEEQIMIKTRENLARTSLKPKFSGFHKKKNLL